MDYLGHDVTLTVEGKEVKVNQVHDALVVDGKIKLFTVNERVLVPEVEAKDGAKEITQE